MKRIYILLLSVCVNVAIYGQLVGSGTASSPYSGGTLTSDLTWSPVSDTVYISGDITIGASGHLTISPGVFVKFLSAGADIIVTGTGRISAVGSASNTITFTADHDRDNIHGEAGETWGHISFQGMSGTNASLFSYCSFEYGRRIASNNSAHADPERYGYGGALHINYSYVTIENCLFRNNLATWGGALFVNRNQNPKISNSYFVNNTAAKGGGGAYFWNGSSSEITNCIFDSNSAQEPSVANYTGGGIAAQTGCSIFITNCTFVNNTSSRPEGQALLLDRSPNSRVINSIFWGSAEKQIYCYQTTTSNGIINSAFRGITASSGTPTNPIYLNESNSHAQGPNFAATDGSDWSIKFISPLRDAGTGSYPGATIPTTDYDGNPRIFTTDIGAYEVEYSRWKTAAASIDWATAANWEASLLPGSTSDIVIPSGASLYPTGTSPVDVTVGSGKFFIMEPGSRATVNNLTNSGTMRLLANSSAFSSLISTSYARSGSGTEEIQVFLSGGGTIDDDDFKWHYISSPVASLPTNIFTGTTLDLAQFVESRPTISLRQGWVAFDGYIYSTGGMGGPTFNSLATGTNGKGYNYWHSSDQTYTFSGLLNTAAVTAPLGFSNNGDLSGYNLLGNPFMSGLDWNYIINDPGFPLNTTKGLYFTRDNMMCSYINGVGVPGDVTGIIPPMQGFFSKTSTTGNSIVIPIEARTHDNIHARYKGSGTVIPLVRLALTGTDLTDETVVRFDEAAKSTLDNDFDAEKFFILETKTYIHTTLGDVKYTINGLPFPETTLEIPVVLNVISDGTHTISASQLQGLDNYRITLLDRDENITTDLRINQAYSFLATTGTIPNRFVLIISDLMTGSEKIDANSGAFAIFEHNGYINITLQNDQWDGKAGAINIIDLTGRTLKQVNGVEFRTGTPVLVQAPEQKGVYLVEIRSGLQRFTGKVMVK